MNKMRKLEMPNFFKYENNFKAEDHLLSMFFSFLDGVNMTGSLIYFSVK